MGRRIDRLRPIHDNRHTVNYNNCNDDYNYNCNYDNYSNNNYNCTNVGDDSPPPSSPYSPHPSSPSSPPPSSPSSPHPSSESSPPPSLPSSPHPSSPSSPPPSSPSSPHPSSESSPPPSSPSSPHPSSPSSPPPSSQSSPPPSSESSPPPSSPSSPHPSSPSSPPPSSQSSPPPSSPSRPHPPSPSSPPPSSPSSPPPSPTSSPHPSSPFTNSKKPPVISTKAASVNKETTEDRSGHITLKYGFHEAFGDLSDCAPGMNACADTMASEIDAATGDTSLVCQAVDKSLSCIATETSSCDVLAKAQIAGAMTNFIETYIGPDFNCTLANANDPAFQTDACGDAMSYCSNFYFEAEFSQEMIDACALFDQYFTCMSTNTSVCTDPTAVTEIQNAVDKTRTMANGEFYFCEERKQYSLDACDSGFDQCVAPISSVGSGKEACQTVDTMISCVGTLTALASGTCSPRQSTLYQGTAKTMSESFTGSPNFCLWDDNASSTNILSTVNAAVAVLAYLMTS
ncbi:flocculation protein FLO11-like [Gigantopelta aegis]|uniref:flocculation protein FLO11-like n=1 Tax=Gigantopelta aegis TaxID=1735272 RepID=UPI001B888041|nr:flocculation protein FLO11-like [Gigantopelta aegis]